VFHARGFHLFERTSAAGQILSAGGAVEKLVDKRDDHAPFADGRRDALAGPERACEEKVNASCPAELPAPMMWMSRPWVEPASLRAAP